jgi:hypothetical protein
MCSMIAPAISEETIRAAESEHASGANTRIRPLDTHSMFHIQNTSMSSAAIFHPTSCCQRPDFHSLRLLPCFLFWLDTICS